MTHDEYTSLLVMLEMDVASGATYLRGKDGRLYRQRDAAELEDRARRGDAAARAALVAVDFGVDADGAAVSREVADAAMRANNDAWSRGDFDELRALGELAPPRKRPPPWLRTSRARRERAAEARRDRSQNSSMRPLAISPDELPRLVPAPDGGLVEVPPARPPARRQI